jgi:hypothetical protein
MERVALPFSREGAKRRRGREKVPREYASRGFIGAPKARQNTSSRF